MNKKNIAFVFAVFAIAFVFVTAIGGVKNGNISVPKFNEKKEVSIYAKARHDIEKGLLYAMDAAHKEAYKYVDKELDAWITELKECVETEFFPSYFNFWNVKGREIKAVAYTVGHAVGVSRSAEYVMIEEIEKMIEQKVIRPGIAQKRIENITVTAASLYLEKFDSEMSKLQEKICVPTELWNECIADLCGLTLDVESKNVPIAIKTAVVSGITGVGLLAMPVTSVVKKVSEKVASKVTTKVVAKTVAKTGAKAVAKTSMTASQAIPFVGLGVSAAVLVWDIVDYKVSAKKGKKALRTNFSDYFAELKSELLGSSGSSIMGSITEWEEKMKIKMEKDRK